MENGEPSKVLLSKRLNRVLNKIKLKSVLDCLEFSKIELIFMGFNEKLWNELTEVLSEFGYVYFNNQWIEQVNELSI